jgi:hypothetical protein
MEDFVIRTGDSKVGILVNEALSALFECIDGLFVPPVSVVSTLIVVSTGGIKSYISLVKGIE